jgi:transposase
MTPEALFTVALGLGEGWSVKQCSFEGTPPELLLKLDFKSGHRFGCPECGASCPTHDTVVKRWRHLDFFQYRCELEARVPRVECGEHGVRLIDVPWGRAGSGFTLLFEALVMMVCREMPMAAAATLLNEHDTRLWRVVAHYVEKAQAERDWSHLKNILIDETSSKRGHRYVTNFVDATTRELLLMVEGHGVDAIAAFHAELARHNGRAEKIELLSMDMKPAFIAGAHRYFPKAEVVFDHFHIMQMAGKALDQVRKALAWEGAQMKGSLWAIRGNAWTRSSSQMEARALGLMDLLQDILSEEDPEMLAWWCQRASRSRLEPFVRLSRSIKAHWNGVVAFMRTRLTNGAMEAINGLLQLAKRLARGFRSLRHFRIMAYLKAGKLQLNIPSLRPLPTH